VFYLYRSTTTPREHLLLLRTSSARSTTIITQSSTVTDITIGAKLYHFSIFKDIHVTNTAWNILCESIVSDVNVGKIPDGIPPLGKSPCKLVVVQVNLDAEDAVRIQIHP
jgi:hypothetical protein